MKKQIKTEKELPKLNQQRDLWKKIGMAHKFYHNQASQNQEQRYETSIALHLLDSQKYTNLQENLVQDSKYKKFVSQVNSLGNGKEICGSAPYCNIKMSQSIVGLSTGNQICIVSQNGLCSACLCIIKPVFKQLQRQIKLYSTDFKIIKSQIQQKLAQMKKPFLQIVNKFKSEQNMFSYDFLSKQLNNKKGSKQKGKFIQQQTYKKQVKMGELQKCIIQLKEQIKFLNNYYLNMKFQTISELKQTQINQKNIKNSLSPSNNSKQNSSFSKSNNASSDESYSESSQSQNQCENDILKSSHQIQRIKCKISSLKNKLSSNN